MSKAKQAGPYSDKGTVGHIGPEYVEVTDLTLEDIKHGHVPFPVAVIVLSVCMVLLVVLIGLLRIGDYRAGYIEGLGERREAEAMEFFDTVTEMANEAECFTGCPDSSEVK